MIKRLSRYNQGFDYWLVMLLIFLAAMNFKAKFFYFAYASLIAFCLFRQRLEIHSAITPYICLSGIMALYSLSGGLMAALRCFSHVAMYLVGYNIVSYIVKQFKVGKNSLAAGESCVQTEVFAIAGGSFAHLMMNFLINRGSDIGRNTIDVWSGSVMAATGQAALGCLGLGVSVALILSDKGKGYRLSGLLAFIGAMAYNTMLGGRTMIFMSLILFALGYAFLVWKETNKGRVIRIAVCAFIIGVCVLVAYSVNLGGMRDQLQSTNLFERFGGDEDAMGITEDTRTDNKIEFIKNAYKYPFGGGNLSRQFGSAHDLVLDSYDEYGLCAFLFTCIILIRGVQELWFVIRDNKLCLWFRLCVLCTYGAILIQFCLEPIFAGMPWLFAVFCLINGSVVALNRVKWY